MTRSYRHSPYCGNTTKESEKQDKAHAHRRTRHAIRQVLRVDHESELLPHDREFFNPWLMDKDGKQYFDPEKFPELMRK